MKAYTDIPQSKVLAEILPLESADMSWVEKGNAKRTWYDAENRRITTKYEKKYYIPCWSLAALLDVIPSGQVNFIRLPLNGENRYAIQVLCGEEWKIGDWKSNPIDACYEMIIKLHEEKLL